MPTIGQVERVARQSDDRDEGLSDWDNALALAGLQPCPEREPARVCFTAAELLEMCLDEVGAMPVSEELKLYARSRGWQFPRLPERWTVIRDRVIATRRREGRSVPEPVLKRLRPSFAAATPAAESRRRRSWTEEGAVEGMVLFLDSHPRKTTHPFYVKFASGRREVCPASSLKQFGGYVRVKKLAERKRRERAMAAQG